MERGYATYGAGAPSRRVPSERLVRAVLLAAIVSSVIHYTDNYVNLEDYPQPHWINHAVVPIAWLAFTAFGILGYVLFRRGRPAASGACLVVYQFACCVRELTR